MEEKQRLSSLIKKILIVFMLFFSIIAFLCGAYHFVLLRSPYYSAFMVYDSFRKNDVQQFDKYCDIEAVYSDAYDQIRNETLDPDTPGGRLAVGLKDYTVKKMAAQLRNQIKERKTKRFRQHSESKFRKKIVSGEYQIKQKRKNINISAFDVLEFGKLSIETDKMFIDRHLNFKYLKFRTAKVIEKEDGAVIVACLFWDTQLDEDLTINVRMIPMDGGKYWRAVAVTNAMETVIFRDLLATQKLDRLNIDVYHEMGRYVQVENTSIKLLKGKTFFNNDKFHYKVTYALENTSKRVNQIEGFFVVYNPKGRVAQKEYHYIDDVASKYDQITSENGGRFSYEWEKFDNIGRLLRRENGLLQKDGDNYTCDFLVKGLYFTDGSYIQALMDLPAPAPN